MTESVVFLQPRTLAEANYQNAFGQEQRWVPWFALFLAPIVQAHGVSVKLVDCRIDRTWRKSIQSLANTDLLAVSVITGHAIRDAVEASHIARSRGAKVVWGGPHPSLFAMETLNEAPVDAVVLGQGYAAMHSMSNAIAAGQWPPENVGGLLTRDGACLTIGSNRVGKTPEPDFDLVHDWNDYVNSDVALASRTINYVASEGCARHCTFCSEPVVSNKVWSPHNVLQTILSIRELCGRSMANAIKFHDANFFHDFDRAMIFAEQLGRKIRLPWAASIHPADLSQMSASDLRRLADSGLSRVLVGLESPLRPITKLAGKQYIPDLAPELAKRLAEAGIRGMFTYIVGWPGASSSHYEQTIAAAERMRHIWSEHQAKIHFLEPWPGTPIFRLLQRDGFVAPHGLNEWANIDYYHANYLNLHDPEQVEEIRLANKRLSPYVDA